MDILFRTENTIFSYRVAGLCVRNEKVLLQKPVGDTAYAFPGGHAALGETNEETLRREFLEEMGAGLSVGELAWVGEIFFPWGSKPCHQICLYYKAEILSDDVPKEGSFPGTEQWEGQQSKLEFHWVPLDRLGEIELYPTNAVSLLQHPEDGVQHFIYRE